MGYKKKIKQLEKRVAKKKSEIEKYEEAERLGRLFELAELKSKLDTVKLIESIFF